MSSWSRGDTRICGKAGARALSGRGLVTSIVSLAAVAFSARSLAGQDVEQGHDLYVRWCVECHGAEGKGDGPAAPRMLPRPRDFTAARYQIRTTGSGELPTDADLIRVLQEGVPGTTMPAWPNLSSGQQEAIVAYLKTLSSFFDGPAPEAMSFSADPGSGPDALESGRKVFETLECFKCHGPAGRGNGPSAPTLEDWREFPIRAADLSVPWLFNGGAGVPDIHARVLTGLDGTPMPSAIDVLEAGIISEDEVWDLARYVRSLAPRETPRVREVVRVVRTLGDLPSAPDDPAWEEVKSFYFPLVGQVIHPPRLFAPTVTGVWVQGIHNGQEITLRLVWHDPSESPDPSWDEWQAKVARTLYDDGVEIPTEPLPDAFAVEFPFEIPEGNKRPYFLMGSSRAPVNLWRWSSQEGVSEGRARGFDEIEETSGAGLVGSARYDEGAWQLVVRRSLRANEGEGISFEEGTPIPVAFFGWDGSSGEEGARGSISSWYYLFLEEPGSPIVFVVPLLAVLLTGGLGFLAVRRARGRWVAGSGQDPFS